MKHAAYIRTVPGSDTAVLLIHGIVGTPNHFQNLLPLLPAQWTVCNMLLDGHGFGVREFGKTSMKKWKAQVDAQLVQLLEQHSRVVIIAHSMGTLFAISQAVRHPQVKALFLLNCPLRVHYPLSTALLTVRAALGRSKAGNVVAMREACGVELTPKLWRYLPWAGRFVELLAEIPRVRRILPRLNVPCFCFQSKHDELVSLRACQDLSSAACIRLEVLPDSGHFAYSKKDSRRIQAVLRGLIARLLDGETVDLGGITETQEDGGRTL